uniref:Uncharacterized protein n=1 Tax=Rhizophora mucronata TaxID=61149 RepID=A0A2P2IZ68_RHIMU
MSKPTQMLLPHLVSNCCYTFFTTISSFLI